MGASDLQPHPSEGPGFEHDQRVSGEPHGRFSAQCSCAECRPERGGAEADADLERRVDRMRLSLGQPGGSHERVTGHSVGRTCPMGFIGFKSLMCHSSRQRQKVMTPATWWSLGKEMAERAKQAALALFDGESEIMRARGLILIDTKCEFGLDRDGVLHVIDEVNTPDSSRLCDVEEWEQNYSCVGSAMVTGRYNTVKALLEVQPEFKKQRTLQTVRSRCVAGYRFKSSAGTEGPKLFETRRL